jgi:hypothetical protein
MVIAMNPSKPEGPCNMKVVWSVEFGGYAIAQAVSRRLSGFDPRSGNVRFVVGKVETGAGFLSISFSPTISHSINCSIFINLPVIDAT